LNGSYGNVEGEEDGRVLVRVDGHDQLFKLKPENLRRVDAATVRGGALEFLQLQAETEFEDLDAQGRAVSKSPSLLYSEGGPQSHRFKLQTYSGFGFANMLDLSDPSVPFFDPMAANRCVRPCMICAPLRATRCVTPNPAPNAPRPSPPSCAKRQRRSASSDRACRF
jgi:hypothetical protein